MQITRLSSAGIAALGLAFLVMWVAAPAVSSPQVSVQRPVTPGDAALPPELEIVESELAKLSERLERRVAVPEPARDPFHFGSPRVMRAALERPAEVAAPMVVDESPIVWPVLVAVLASADGDTRQVALDVDTDGLHVAGLHETVSGFRVHDVGEDGATLVHVLSGRTRQFSLR